MDKIETLEQLREIYREPSERAQLKQLDALDAHCLAFIALSPFVVLASSARGGAPTLPRGVVNPVSSRFKARTRCSSPIGPATIASIR